LSSSPLKSASSDASHISSSLPLPEPGDDDDDDEEEEPPPALVSAATAPAVRRGEGVGELRGLEAAAEEEEEETNGSSRPRAQLTTWVTLRRCSSAWSQATCLSPRKRLGTM
jgi:hypothetical protein